MNIEYETNGLGFLGWITDLPGAYLRGATIGEARAKIGRETADYAEWLGIRVSPPAGLTESVHKSGLHVEDADSDIIFESEKTGFANMEEFDRWCALVRVSGARAEEVYEDCGHRDVPDPRLQRATFYGEAYPTVRTQFAHIVDVQNYYLAQIGTGIRLGGGLKDSRPEFAEQLRAKYLSEGNRLYSSDAEEWTIKKIIRRIIWHDRIHARAMQRIEARMKAEK